MYKSLSAVIVANSKMYVWDFSHIADPVDLGNNILKGERYRYCDSDHYQLW